jgi:hypothetical protein
MSVSIRRLLNAIRPSACAIFVGSLGKHADVAADAERLIASFHDQAYYEARDRARGRCIDGAGSARYWTRVKLEIAKRQRIAIGLAGADMRA